MTSARTLASRPLTLAGVSLLVMGGMLSASPAEARDYHGHDRGHNHSRHYHGRHGFTPNISLNINPRPYYAPPPVYYAPAPVYYAPQPVYYAPAPTYYAPPYTYYGSGYYPPRRHVSTSFNFNWR